VPLSAELVSGRRAGGVELDSIDDELFMTDYRSPTQARHLTLLPEPPTVRLAQHAQVTWSEFTAPPAVSPPGPWVCAAYYPASEYTGEENGTEIVLLVGVAVLLVVAIAGAGVVLWWFA
jgi:hypothetical protein